MVAVQASKRLAFKQFCEALALCAEARSMPADDFNAKVAATQPHAKATVADNVKWHDDKSKYTGAPCACLQMYNDLYNRAPAILSMLLLSLQVGAALLLLSYKPAAQSYRWHTHHCTTFATHQKPTRIHNMAAYRRVR